MPRVVFISYLADRAEALRIRDRLANLLGGSNVVSIDDIPPGADFEHWIAGQIRRSDVLLVVIGRNWSAQVANAEIALAFEQGKQIIPVLVGGASMPSAGELGGPSRFLANLPWFEISDDSFDDDIERLAVVIHPLSSAPPAGGFPRPAGGPRPMAANEMAAAARTVRRTPGRPSSDGFPDVSLEKLVRQGFGPIRSDEDFDAIVKSDGPESSSADFNEAARREAESQAESAYRTAEDAARHEAESKAQWARESEAEADEADDSSSPNSPAAPPSPPAGAPSVGSSHTHRHAHEHGPRSRGSRFPYLPGLGLALVAAVGLGFALRHGFGAMFDWIAAPIFHGALPPPPATQGATEPATELADVIAFAPPRAARGQPFLVQVFIGKTGEDEEASRTMAIAADPATAKRAIATLDVALAHGDRIDVRLEAAGLTIDDAQQTLVWRGDPRSVAFLVSAPPDFTPDKALIQARIFRQAIPIGKIAFSLPVEGGSAGDTAAPAGDVSHRYRRAFLSYSSTDRAEVFKRAQALQAAGLEFFVDLDSLRPGEKWEPRLLSEIDQCDLFVLFWSKAARESEWVNKEIAYALERIGKQTPPESARPDIQPILIEGPPPPKPPDSLRSLHFNDRFLYMIAAIENQPPPPPKA